jgi:hypothetical protein
MGNNSSLMESGIPAMLWLFGRKAEIECQWGGVRMIRTGSIEEAHDR